MSLRDRAAIVGIGQLPFSKNIGRPEEVTALDAAKLALEDAGLGPSDIDGMTKWSIQPTSENVIARNLGVPVESPQRIQAGVIFCLQEAESSGHCFLLADQLIRMFVTTVLNLAS